MTAIAASSAGVKDMADGSLRITLEFEPRYAKEAYALFGARGTAIAVARLTQEAAIEHAQTGTINEPKGGAGSQWLAIRCGEPEFWGFIEYSAKITDNWIKSAEMCDAEVKNYLNIASKKELDHDHEAAHRFHEMIRKPYAKWLAGER